MDKLSEILKSAKPGTNMISNSKQTASGTSTIKSTIKSPNDAINVITGTDEKTVSTKSFISEDVSHSKARYDTVYQILYKTVENYFKNYVVLFFRAKVYQRAKIFFSFRKLIKFLIFTEQQIYCQSIKIII